jgi:CRISPR/Cas system Type II protein with McrA/HNH and RuvC-like nuclease domain
MKFKHIIGLDIGTNSLGWSLIKEYENQVIEIEKIGVHIFPIGTIVDEKNNKEKTKNEQRRGYRSASRMRYRFKLRRKNLKKALKRLGMLPDYQKLLRPNDKKGQSYELYKLRASAINPKIKIPLQEIGRIFMLLNKYRGFKSNSKKLDRKDEESGKVKRGYESLQYLIDKSGSETIGQYFFKMHEKARQWYNENKWHNFNEPIDERAYNDDGEFVLFNSNGIRRHGGRYTLRDMYLLEFDRIWAAQQNHHPEILTGSKRDYDEIMELSYKERIKALKEFKKTNYWHIRDYCIYYQRPLKSQKKYVSNCQFERGSFNITQNIINENSTEKIKEKKIWKKKAKKVCPKSHPYFQEFRIWQKLHQISYSSIEEDVLSSPLNTEWLPVLTETLMQNAEIFLNKTPKIVKDNKLWVGKILQEKGMIQNSDNYTFHIDKSDEDIDHEEKNENRIIGNVTYSSFIEALGGETFYRLKNETIKRREQINKEEEIEVQESKLLVLWHHLYIAKDGLFREEDWLKSILTEPTKWNFTIEQAQKLIEIGLQPDHGSYSMKVIKAILPGMRKGLNEYEALKAIGKGCVNEDNTIGKQVKLKKKIAQLRYQELRNPVVERALSKAIKLVNAILERNEIDRENFEIRIESTRQFRKPRQERENERRKNSEKDKLRGQYAAHLTKNKEQLGFKRDIHKYDPIIGKYELWLQMNMNERDNVFLNEFSAFSQITKKEDRLKHKLWLECGRMCPYTGNIINFTDCFSPEVEIEHIIPLSRSLDDSFNNKTLTYRHINIEKGKMTPLEFMKKLGGDALKRFKARINANYNDFSESKKKQFLIEKIDDGFLNHQLSNTSYIAKYAKNKMHEVCRNVQFTNGSATYELRSRDWGLSNLLDKIRYEEDFGINMDGSDNEPGIYANYYRIKKSFLAWCEKKYNSTDLRIEWENLQENKDLEEYSSETNDDLLYWHNEIEKFNQFRNKDGKKDRSDHRHHAIDAFVTACCSPAVINQLAAYNAMKEEHHLEYRDKIARHFEYTELKKAIASILVSHSEKQTLIKKRKNKIKTNNGIETHITYAPQGKLHEESFYSKRNGATVRRVELFDDQRQEKALFNSAPDLDYAVKKTVKWHYIDDRQLYEIAKIRLEKLNNKAFTRYEMEKTPFYRTSPQTPNKFTSKKKGKPLPIVKSIRKRFNIDRTLINLPAKDEMGNIINENRYADNESNTMMIFYENTRLDKKGVPQKPQRDFEILSFYKAVNLKNPYNKISYQNGKLFTDEKDGIGLNNDCRWLKNGDMVILFIDEKDKRELDWGNNSILKERIFIVKGLSSDSRTIRDIEYEYGYTSLLKTRIAKTASYPTIKNISESIDSKSSKISHVKLNAIKIRLNILGEIQAKGERCF